MQASSPPKANKPQAPTHPHINNNIKPHLTTSPNCKYAKTDNLGYINCTKNDSTIGLCQNPCPYTRKPHLHPLAQCTYISLEAQSKALPPREAQIKLCYAVFRCTYILTAADGVDV